MTPPDDMTRGATALVQMTKNLTIASPEEYAECAEQLIGVKDYGRRVADYFRPLKRAQDQAKAAILDAEKQLSVPLAQAESALKLAMSKYTTAQEQIRQAEQRRLQAEADERARRDREALEKKAAKMKTEAKQEEYRERAAAVVAPVVQVPKTTPKVAGVTTRRVWKWKVDDALVVPREFLMIDKPRLDQIARSLGDQLKVPGITFFQEEQLAVGRAPGMAEEPLPLE